VSSVSQTSRPKIAAKARLKWDRHERRHVLLYPERGLVLNESAAAILELCDGVRTIQEIARTLAARASDAPARVEPEVLSFVEALHKKGLLALVES
jgi:coenzyme PQQ biosynthesis protein PqqD